jgi:hypothetical protein
VITDAHGTRLVVTPHRRQPRHPVNAVTRLMPLLDAIPHVRGRRAGPYSPLRIRWEVRDDIHEAFLKLACCVITHRPVRALC